MTANNRQVGGAHYIKLNYQPWDFFIDAEIAPPIDFAIKYIARWRDKEKPIQDLEKAIHCLEKAIQRECKIVKPSELDCYWQRFTAQLPHREQLILRLIVAGEFFGAIDEIQEIIDNPHVFLRGEE